MDQKSADILHSSFESPVGWIKISTDEKYVTGINFIDERVEDSAAILNCYHHLQCVAQLQEYFQGIRREFELPLKQKGTDFQLTTWSLLQEIPFGKTISYLQLAKKYGDAKAIRAMASANGRNNLAIVVPCHRVIGSDQSLVGYAGGLWRKKWLLNLENKVANGLQTLF